MNTRSASRSLLVFTLVLGGAAVGCGATGGGEAIDEATAALATDGADAVSSNDTSINAIDDAGFEFDTSSPIEAAAALVNAAPDALDGGCRTRAKAPNDPTTVIITLTNCTGRFGKHHVSGTEIIHFTKGAGPTLLADLHSENLTVNGQPASHTASALITFAEGSRTIAWQGSFEYQGKNGAAIEHSSDLTIEVDKVAHCRTRNGTAVTHIGDRQIDTTFEDVSVCRDESGVRACPTGVVTHTNAANGKQITVEFDGSNQAQVTGPQGQTFDKPLLCGG